MAIFASVFIGVHQWLGLLVDPPRNARQDARYQTGTDAGSGNRFWRNLSLLDGVDFPGDGNFPRPRASNPMSSSSGTQHDRAAQPGAAPVPPIAPDDARQRGIELIHHAQLGDRGAFADLVRLYQDRLYNAILRIVGDFDDARDLTQDTFTRALDKIDSFRGDAQPYTWLFRIATNLAISELRKSNRRRTFTLGAAGSNGSATANDDQASNLIDRVGQQDRDSSDPARLAETQERSQQVLDALGRVDPEYRAILVMRDVEGFDYQQMADVLHLPLGTLKSRLFRARVALRDELMPYMKGTKK